MKFRYKDKPESTGFSSEFNVHGLGENILFFEEGDATSEDFDLLEVLIENPVTTDVDAGTWVDFKLALTKRYVIGDDYQRWFREPANTRERDRGWYLRTTDERKRNRRWDEGERY